MANNISISVTADVSRFTSQLAVARAQMQDYGKVMRSVAQEVAKGDASQETATRLLEVSEAYAKAATQAAYYQRAARATAYVEETAAAQKSAQIDAGLRFVEQLKEQAATLNLTKTELLEYKAAQLGVAAEAAPAIAAIAAATVVENTAGRQFIEQLREQAATLNLTKTELLEYKAAQLGVAAEAQPMIAAIRAASEVPDTGGQKFIEQLTEEAATLRLTRAQLLEYKAAKLGVAEQAAPLIQTVTANDLSAGQRYIQQLKEQTATARLSRYELLEYRAAELGVTQEATPLIAKLRELNEVQRTSAGISGQQRFGLIVVGEQLRQVSTEAALGIAPMQIFAQQSGQTIQALAMVAGEGTALGAFLTSGWGIALTTATAALAPLIAELVKTSGVLADVGDAAETAMAKLNQSLDRSSDFTKVADEATKKYIGGLKELADAQRDLKFAQDSRAAAGAINGPFGAGVARPDQDVAGAQARVDAAKKKIKDAQDELKDLRDAERIAELQDAARAKLNALDAKPARASNIRGSRASASSSDAAARAAAEAQRQQQQIADSNAQTTLAVQRSGITDKRQAANFDFDQSLSTISADTEIGAAERKRDVLKALAEEEANDEIAAQRAKAAARLNDPVVAAEAANQIKVINANLNTTLASIDRQYTSDHEREVARRMEAERRANEQRLQLAQRTNQGILEIEGQLVSSILSGRQTAAQILTGLAVNVAQREIRADIQYFTERRLLAAQGLSAEAATTEKGLLLQILGHQRKKAAAAAAIAAETTTTVAGEAAKTAAVTTGVAARTASTAAGAATSAAIVGKHNLKEITSHAATAAAAAYHAMAGIPVIGPALGAAAAAATFVAVEAFGALASFDKGTNYVPNDMVAQIHAGERIVPAADNRELMAAVRGDGGRGDVNLHYAPTINGSLPFADQLSAHEDNVISIVRRAARSGALRY